MRRVLLLFMAAAVWLNLSGCATTRPAATAGGPPPLQIDDRVLVVSADTLTIGTEFEKLGAGDGVKQGLAEGALGGAYAGLVAGLETGFVLLPPAAALLIGGGAVVGSVAGGVVGGFQAASAGEVKCVASRLESALQSARPNERLALELQQCLREYSSVDLPIRKEATAPGDALYPKLLFVHVDGKRFGSDDKTTIVLKATLLRRQSDGTVKSFGNLEHTLRPRTLAQWCGLSSESLGHELLEGVAALAQQMSDVLLVAAELDRPSTRQCPSYRGLAPVAPPVRAGLFGQPLYAPADSRQPVLSWEPFPRLVDLANSPLVAAVAGAIVYDLQLWSVSGDELAGRKLVYARTGLREPRHRVEVVLKAGAKYAWEVRPRFYLNGVRRSLPWSRLTYNVEECVLATGYESLYLFETPGAGR